MGSDAGVPDEKILALENYATSPHFTDCERIALRYADAITRTGEGVDEELFSQLRNCFNDEQIVELTMTIAWENASSKFNRALRIPSQNLWKRRAQGSADNGDKP